MQKKAVLEINLNNPTDEEMTLEVDTLPRNAGLSGPETITLPPKKKGLYQLDYAPAVIGETKGRY